MLIEPWKRTLAAVRSRWVALERDWRSVAIGATIAASVGLLDLQIPW